MKNLYMILLLTFLLTGCMNQANIKDSKSIAAQREPKEKVQMHINTPIKDTYDIIRISPDSVKYKPTLLKDDFLDDHVDYDQVHIPMGKSRIGGPVVDLPPSIDYPKNMYFAGQFNLQELSKYDDKGYLPKTGFLYVFVDDDLEGKVIYADCEVNSLKRVIKEHEGTLFDGCLIADYRVETESVTERYDEEWAKDGEELGWNYFAGFEKTKFFGMYNNCQLEEEEILEIMSSTQVLLLQIGEEFTVDGILNVLIEEEDLKNKNFNNCIVEWSQS